MVKFGLSSQIKDLYEDVYQGGGSEWRRLGALGKADNIVKLCAEFPHESILEIGAGEGSILQRLAELDFGRKYSALEVSASGVETISRKGIPRLVESRLFDGYHVPYDAGSFDVAILSHVVEHLEHPRQLVYEAARVARFVFVEVPLEETLRLPKEFVLDNVGHINTYSPRSIRRFLQSCRLDILRQEISNPSKGTYTFKKGRAGLINFYIKAWLLRLVPAVATKVFTYHAAVLCRRST